MDKKKGAAEAKGVGLVVRLAGSYPRAFAKTSINTGAIMSEFEEASSGPINHEDSERADKLGSESHPNHEVSPPVWTLVIKLAALTMEE